MAKLSPVFLAALLLAVAAAVQTGAIEIGGAWARATPGSATNGAAYLTVEAREGDRLIGVSTPVARQAGLHEMSMAGGVATMRPIAAVDLPAGRPVALQPGGVHIMLTGLTAPLRRGQSFPLTLHFAKAGAREVVVTVGAVGAMGPTGDRQGSGDGTTVVPPAQPRQER